MPDMWLELRAGGSESTSFSTKALASFQLRWTHRSEAAAMQAIADGVEHILAALNPHEYDAPKCGRCGKPLSWSKERLKWRCHNSHRPKRLTVGELEALVSNG